MRRLKLISCEVFHREMCAVVARAHAVLNNVNGSNCEVVLPGSVPGHDSLPGAAGAQNPRRMESRARRPFTRWEWRSSLTVDLSGMRKAVS